ncbi:MAG: hypothetical protein L3K23_10495 [Thermoplasmata archaeon]|nr:hypothetical protein [Thermoplasmata archaeon]
MRAPTPQRWAAIATVALLLASGMVLLGSLPSAKAQGPPFAFPFAYGTPAVPTSTGPQGHVGTVLPLAAVGAPASVGATGHLGPVNVSDPFVFASALPRTLALTLLNGTTSSSVNAVHQSVALENVTYGTWVRATTGTTGKANLTAPQGWYLLWANATTAASFISFEQEYYLGANVSLTRYLIPTALSVVAVNNGPTASRATLFLQAQGSFGTLSMPQLTVELLNSSSGNAILGTAYSLPNGTVEFTGVDSAFSYNGDTIGDGASAVTGVNYLMSNGGWGFSTPGAGTQGHSTANNPLNGDSTTTGVLVGSALPTLPGNGRWGIAVNTTVTGGTTVLSAALSSSHAYDVLTIRNGQLVLNWSWESEGNVVPVHLVNSTLVVVTQFAAAGDVTLPVGTFSGVNAAVYGDAPSGQNPNGPLLSFVACRWCLLTNVWVGGGNAFLSGSFSNSSVVNSTSLSLGSAGSDGQSGAQGTYLNYSNLVNVTLAGGGSGKALVLGHDALNLTVLTANRFAASFVNASYVGTTSYLPWAVGDTAISLVGKSTWRNDTLAYAYDPLNVPWATWFDRATATDTSWSFSTVNFSSVKFDLTANSVPVRTVALLSTHLWLYDCWVDANYSATQLLHVAQNLSSNVARASMLNVNSAWTTWANYTTFDTDGNSYLATNQGNGSFNHDLWPWLNVGNAYAGFSLFGQVPSGYLEHVTLGNDSFRATTLNATVFGDFQRTLYGPVGIEWLFDTNFNRQSTPIGTLGVNYTEFRATPVGVASLFPAGDLQLGVDKTAAWVDHDVFRNSPTDSHMPTAYANGTYYVPPYATDVEVDGGTAVVSHDTFLNLSNETVPVGENSGAQGSGARPAVTLLGDRFYWRPTPLESFVNPVGPWATQQTKPTPHDTYLSSLPLVSNATYEVPIDKNASLAFTSGGQFVFNTSATVANGYPSGSFNTPTIWVWAVAPDANTSNGSLVVGYGNGLVAGPQPKLTFSGHAYNESVEPAWVQFNADATSAPPVYAQFSGLTPSVNYSVLAYAGNGTLLSTVTATASTTGLVNATYTPSTEGKNVTLDLVGPPGGGGFALPTTSLALILVVVGVVLLLATLLALAATRRRKYR